MVSASTAGVATPHHDTVLGMDAHQFAMYGSIALGLFGIVVAYVLHLAGRTSALVSKADAISLGAVQKAAQGKWYVDEIYDFLFVKPLWVLSHVLHLFDKLVVDGLVNLAGLLPRGLGHLARKQQSGVLHDYALRMAAGLAIVVLVVLAILAGGTGGEGVLR